MDVLNALLSALTGAAVVGVPLWIKIRQVLRTEANNKAKNVKQRRISIQAEWRQILEERAKEEGRLRARDDEQDKRHNDLLTRFIESEKEKAAALETVRLLKEQMAQLIELLMNRCPQCPSRPLLTAPLSVRSSSSSPVPTVTSADSPSPSGNWPALGSDKPSETPASSPLPAPKTTS